MDVLQQHVITKRKNNGAMKSPSGMAHTAIAINSCIHELFERQVAKTPDAVAIVFGDAHLSYRALNTKANRLANYMIGGGIIAGDAVALYFERSLEMVVAMFAALKAGAAFVPLDPNHPPARLKFILDETKSRLLLTHKNLLEKVPDSGIDTFCIDCEDERFAAASDANPHLALTPDFSAYVIYTSGSTGKPKGVLGAHLGVVNYLRYMVDAYNLDENDVILQLPAMSFDASFRDLIGPLVVGARVEIVSQDEAKDFKALLLKIEERAITCLLSVVPTMLQGFIEMAAGKGHTSRSLRLILVSGEPLQESLCYRARQIFGEGVLFINQYGPTECTMTSTYFALQVPKNTSAIARIGKPITGRTSYVLDAQLNRLENGEIGDIYLGGIGLAYGYLRRADLTAKSFLPDLYGTAVGGRIYHTGDLGCFHENDTLTFVGRSDTQVKLRGHRVELLEIEKVLSGHPKVKTAVVLLREDQPGDSRLAGYLLTENGRFVSEKALRHYLQARLPEYMIPSQFVFLYNLPLTPNGKIDRNALPAPKKFSTPKNGKTAIYRNKLEFELIQIWQDLLGAKPLDPDDNFFEIGGHSLLAVRVLSEIEKKYHVSLPLVTLLNAPTIRKLSRKIRKESKVELWSPLVPLQPNGTKRPFFMVHPAAGSVLGFFDLARHLGQDQPFYGLQAYGIDKKQKPDESIELMAKRYITAMKTVQPEGPYLLGGRCIGGLIAFEMAQQLQVANEKVDFLAIFDTQDILKSGIEGKVSKNGKWENKKTSKLKKHEKIYEINPQISRMLLIQRKHQKARKKYVARQYQGRITLFRNGEEKPVPEFHVKWQKLAKGGFAYHLVPGEHAFILREPHVRSCAAKLKACLDNL